jgi:hypothetical protein
MKDVIGKIEIGLSGPGWKQRTTLKKKGGRGRCPAHHNEFD